MEATQEELWPKVPTRTMRFQHHGLIRVGGGEYRHADERDDEPDIGTLRRTVLDYFRECRGRGSTDHEGQAALHIPGNTWRPRRRELEKDGFIVQTLYRRPTPSGLNAKVYKAAEYVRGSE